ncbi:Pseudouridylate Synthase 7-Like Protein [Manis pentadactyla]|nr:Pseudouridylate Synthase 7-Like Protein [Manis pentadactyla]
MPKSLTKFVTGSVQLPIILYYIPEMSAYKYLSMVIEHSTPSSEERQIASLFLMASWRGSLETDLIFCVSEVKEEGPSRIFHDHPLVPVPEHHAVFTISNANIQSFPKPLMGFSNSSVTPGGDRAKDTCLRYTNTVRDKAGKCQAGSPLYASV